MRGVVGTGGHIDHGKTALIRALTGENTDRLPEEQRRGISIDLGFSHLELDGLRLGIVDVPGHEDFIRNMLAGATGIDLLLLVIAADDGVMPQTREHTAIAEILGVERAVVALTKIDLVDDDWLGLAHDDVADFLAGTAFAGARVITTSAETGEGVPELRDAIRAAFDAQRRRPDDRFRLPVDRAFTVRGTGTVVTGTVWSGRLGADAVVRLLPDGPEARVRGLQVHGQDVAAVEAGERAAVALTGVDRDRIERGMTVVADEGWAPAPILTVRLRVLPGSDWRIEDRQRVRVHLGTAEVMARAGLLDRETPLLAGDEAWAQLRLESPLLARAGDRVVVRSYSPVTTIGGGIVAEPQAPRRQRLRPGDDALFAALVSGDPERAGPALLRAAGHAGVPLAAIPVLTGAAPPDVQPLLAEAVIAGGRAFDHEALGGVTDTLLAAVTEHHERCPLEHGIDPEAARRACGGADAALVEHAIEQAIAEDRLVSRQGRLARADWEISLTPAQEQMRERLAAAIAAAGAGPPPVEEVIAAIGDAETGRALLALLEEEGRVVRLEHDLYMDAATLDGVVRDVRARFAGRDDLGPADFREVVDVSRKHLMPLLGCLDRLGVTVRTAEGRAVAR